jgi:hypothetical protein
LLAFSGRGKDGSSYQVQFPLFWRFAHSSVGSSTTVTPLGFFGTSPAGWRAGLGPVLPLIWAAGGGPRRHFVLFLRTAAAVANHRKLDRATVIGQRQRVPGNGRRLHRLDRGLFTSLAGLNNLVVSASR